jgi:cyanoexosortase B-associated protein
MDYFNLKPSLYMNLSQLQGKWSFGHFTLLLLLMILIVIAAIPGYWQGGNWSWLQPPTIDNINQIKSLRKTGLTLPDWQIKEQQQMPIGGHKWLVQTMIQPQQKKPITLLILPQNYYLDKPQIEWMDINGLESWKTDSYQKLSLTFTDDRQTETVTTRFFRAWNRQQTFAVLQWYAFPQGGHHSTTQWFWRDLLAQLHGSRVPWIAVSCKIPIEPLGEIAPVEPLAESLVESIQTHLYSRNNS